jgi:phosphoglycerate dehydrogenase-like enzyme
MKAVYLVRNAGIASRTPAGWESSIVSPRNGGGYTEEDISEMASATALVVGLDGLPAEVFDRAKGLRLVQRLGVGYCNIDLEAARRHGVPVCNMPDFNAATVAEHTLMLVLALQRRVFDATLWMKAGRWPTNELVGAGIFELAGKTVGLVGFGAIGRAVARRALAFDARICYYDRKGPDPEAHPEPDAVRTTLADVLSRSDIVSIHVPLTPLTRRMIGSAELSTMKPGALLINTARGAIVDEAALADALKTKRLAGAGLDVFEDEPLGPHHPLRNCPNTLLTPHLAGQTREAMERMAAAMVDNLQRVARGDEPRYRVV